MSDSRKIRISRTENDNFRSHIRRSPQRNTETWERGLETKERPRIQEAKKTISITKREEIDRKKICPMLIRTFISTVKRNKPSDYANGNFPENERFIYAWKDITLRELTHLVIEAFPEARKFNSRMDFSIVYPNMKNRCYDMKHFGSTCVGLNRPNDNISLNDTKFQIGDCLDVAVFYPRQRMNRMKMPNPEIINNEA